MPWRVAFALQADGWYLRSDIVWSKPNPMPESVVDRPTKAHEMLFLLAKRPRYFYDADAIREPHVDPERGANGQHVGSGPDERPEPGVRTGTMLGIDRAGPRAYNPAGRNRRSVWTIATEPFPEAHFATYPQALVRPCIQAGTSERGECSECGAPWVREVERTNERVGADRGGNYAGRTVEGYERREDGSLREIAGAARPQRVMQGGYRPGARYVTNDLGWKPSCGCVGESASSSYPDTGKRFVVSEPPPTRPQLVLDPFIGSGTTALVARNHGRRCIGIDLALPYLEIAARRLQQLSLLGELA